VKTDNAIPRDVAAAPRPRTRSPTAGAERRRRRRQLTKSSATGRPNCSRAARARTRSPPNPRARSPSLSPHRSFPMPTDFRSVPGLYTGNQFTTRQVVRSLSSRDYLPSGVIIDGSLSRDIGSSPRRSSAPACCSARSRPAASTARHHRRHQRRDRRRCGDDRHRRRGRRNRSGAAARRGGRQHQPAHLRPAVRGRHERRDDHPVTAASGTTLTITSPRCRRTWTSRSSRRRTARSFR
jgi:hypothetical protein